jgi:hypothetical protein
MQQRFENFPPCMLLGKIGLPERDGRLFGVGLSTYVTAFRTRIISINAVRKRKYHKQKECTSYLLESNLFYPHVRSCPSIVAILTLEVTGIPEVSADREFPWPKPSFIDRQSRSAAQMFEVSNFNCILCSFRRRPLTRLLIR